MKEKFNIKLSQHIKEVLTELGVQKQNSLTTTSAFSGNFKNDEKTRAEFMNLIKRK